MANNTDPRLQNQVIYSVYVRNHTPEGTFRAVIPDLDRIKSLGTDIIWFLPIHPIGEAGKKGSLGCPYANRDYRTVNPAYGTMEDFQALVDAIHARGMQCMIDVVYNHTSPDSVLFQEHPEFFYRGPDGRPGNKIGDWSDVIDLDYSHPGLWDYLTETLVGWAKIVDGFRCDVASAVPLAFWREAREQVERVRPGCIWLAESVHAAHTMAMRRAGYYCAADTELYDAFDITYDYDIWPYFEGCFQPTGTLREYTALVNFQESEYPAGYVKLRCLENHDQPRFASRVDSDEALRNWLALLYFEKGTTLLYSGQEYAPRHRVDLFNADDAYCDMRLDLQPYLKQLRQMKRTLPMSACFQLEAVEERAVVGRYDGPEARVRGIFDLKNAGGSVAVDLPDGTYTDRITGREVTVSGGAFDLAQAPAVIG